MELGNLNAMRDWGHAQDYVEAMYLMLQSKVPNDYVVATGETHSVREFCDVSFSLIGMPLTWKGEGVEEVGVDQKGIVRVKVNPKYFRPTEVDFLLGDSTLVRKDLGWKPKLTFKDLAEDMVKADVDLMKKDPNA